MIYMMIAALLVASIPSWMFAANGANMYTKLIGVFSLILINFVILVVTGVIQ